MENQTFFRLSEKEKQEKLIAVLRSRSGGRLTADEIREIIRMLAAGRQYEVMVYSSPEDFCTGIGRDSGSRRRLVLGADCVAAARKGTESAGAGTVAVSVRRTGDGEEVNELHIFIPPEREAA